MKFVNCLTKLSKLFIIIRIEHIMNMEFVKIMPDNDKIIADKNMRGRPAERADAFNGKFWFLIVVMIGVIAVGGVLLS